MDTIISPAKKFLVVFAAMVIAIAPLVISKVVVYEYNNPKLFAIELGLATVIAGIVALFPLGLWKRGLNQPMVWGMKLFLLAFFVSTLFSIDRTTSWFGNIDRGTGTFYIAILTVAAIAMGLTFSKVQARKYVLVPVAISGTVVALSVSIGEMGWKVLSTAGNAGVFGNTSVVAAYLLMTFFVTLYLLVSSSTARTKWCYGIAMAIMVINTVFVNFAFFSQHQGLFSALGEAKGGALSIGYGLIIALAVWLATSAGKAKKWIGIVLLALTVLATVVSVVQLVQPQTRVHAWFVSKETDVRFIYWNTGMQAFRAHPVLGTGPETYSYSYQKYFDPIVMLKEHSGEIWSNKPHNAYVEILSETGIMGMIGYLAMIGAFLYSLIVIYRRDGDRKLLAVMSGLLAAYLLDNLIFFDTVGSYFLLFMIFSFIISASPHDYIEVIAASWERAVRYVLALAIVALVAIIVIPQIVKTNRAYKEFLIPLDRRVSYYQKVEDTASYGSSLFVSQRADFSYHSIFEPNLNAILQQPEGNRTIAANAIQGLIDTVQNSFNRYGPNEQGALAMAHLASIKMVIVNAPDTASLETMKSASQAAIVLSPSNPNGYLLLGQAYVYEQKYDDAYAQFEKARSLQPLLIEPHMALINLATMLQDQKRVLFYFNRARQESPDFAATAHIK